MLVSKKPKVFENLFRERFDETTGALKSGESWIVKRPEIIAEIRKCGLSLGKDNGANFLKDFLRPNTRNENWPAYLQTHRFSAKQVYGKRGELLVFEFIPYEAGQSEPFPDFFEGAIASEDIHTVESVSMPSAARILGRPDEAWLIQACVHQRVIETHFALRSPLNVLDVFHLQNSVKTTPEIDALFLISLIEGGELKKAIVTFEAKREEFILLDQIKAQIAKMAHECKSQKGLADIDYVIGMACQTKAVAGDRVVCLFELKHIAVDDAAAFHKSNTVSSMPVSIATRGAYAFQPQIKGI